MGKRGGREMPMMRGRRACCWKAGWPVMQFTSLQFARAVEGLRKIAADSAANDKRRTTRMIVQAKVEAGVLRDGRLMARFSAMTRDVSLGGAGLLQSVPMEAGQEMVVELPGVLATFKVAHCRTMAHGIFAVGLELEGEATAGLKADWAGYVDAQRAAIRQSVLA